MDGWMCNKGRILRSEVNYTSSMTICLYYFIIIIIIIFFKISLHFLHFKKSNGPMCALSCTCVVHPCLNAAAVQFAEGVAHRAAVTAASPRCIKDFLLKLKRLVNQSISDAKEK